MNSDADQIRKQYFEIREYMTEEKSGIAGDKNKHEIQIHVVEAGVDPDEIGNAGVAAEIEQDEKLQEIADNQIIDDENQAIHENEAIQRKKSRKSKCCLFCTSVLICIILLIWLIFLLNIFLK